MSFLGGRQYVLPLTWHDSKQSLQSKKLVTTKISFPPAEVPLDSFLRMQDVIVCYPLGLWGGREQGEVWREGVEEKKKKRSKKSGVSVNAPLLRVVSWWCYPGGGWWRSQVCSSGGGGSHHELPQTAQKCHMWVSFVSQLSVIVVTKD